MTNEEKAQEIAKVHEVHYDRFHGETSNDECFLSALEMAKWKDENFDAFLDYLIVLGDKDIIDAICDYRGEKLEE